ncbi:MAG: histidine kinase [Candidatus Azobacteroides sp.]|nr:histidine kinase [Candidatus Azobacteroides sp.]
MWNKTDNKIPFFLLSPDYRTYRHLALQLILFLITINVFWDEPNKMISGRAGVWFVYFLLLNAMVYINMYVLVPRLLFKGKILFYLMTVPILIIFAVFCIGVLQEITSPATPDTETPHVGKIILGIVSSVLSFGLFLAGISAFQLLKYRMQQSEQITGLEKATLSTELTFLKNQINPHFLFNMLNNANIMVHEDPSIAKKILNKLNDLLKYQIKDSTKDRVLLKDDIAFLQDFLELEKTRRDNFDFTITRENLNDPIFVPPLLFIPFVENAVKHNPDNRKGSYVNLNFRMKNNELTFICKNSKPKNPVKGKVGGIGLTNIRKRLDLVFGKHYKLEFKEEETTFTVSLKLKLLNANQ